MIDLVLAVIFGTLAAVVYKTSIRMGCRRFPLIAVERGTMMMLMMALYSLNHSGYELNAGVIVVSLAAGVSIFAARWFLLKALSLGNVNVCWTILSLSITVPVAFSILIWQEIPNACQTIGLLLTPLGIVFM